MDRYHRGMGPKGLSPLRDVFLLLYGLDLARTRYHTMSFRRWFMVCGLWHVGLKQRLTKDDRPRTQLVPVKDGSSRYYRFVPFFLSKSIDKSSEAKYGTTEGSICEAVHERECHARRGFRKGTSQNKFDVICQNNGM